LPLNTLALYVTDPLLLEFPGVLFSLSLFNRLIDEV
jgi:hypothetical protein